MTLVLPALAERWVRAHGDVGRSWLGELPAIAQHWSQAWGLTIHGPLTGGSVSVVLAVERGAQPGVLKLAAPWSRWSRAEAEALRVWDGACAPRLLAASDDAAALLIERVMPGNHPPSPGPSEIAELLRRVSKLPEAAPAEIPPLTEAILTRFARAQENRSGLIDAARLERARAAACEMARDNARPPVLLHGDFLTKNLLCRGEFGEIVVIDPNPAVGDLSYDVAQWAIAERPIGMTWSRCAAVCSALRLDVERVWAWALALGAVEISLASEQRARETLDLVAAAAPEWW